MAKPSSPHPAYLAAALTLSAFQLVAAELQNFADRNAVNAQELSASGAQEISASAVKELWSSKTTRRENVARSMAPASHEYTSSHKGNEFWRAVFYVDARDTASTSQKP